MPKRRHQPTANFEHRRLSSPRSFRLVSLHSSSDPSAPLDVSLFEASLGEFPSTIHTYEALSYVWGASTGILSCNCEGRELLITPNCNEALRHLRLPDQHRSLWIDAICIDQGDSDQSLKERNTQITLMGEIYGNARRTLCWLGAGEEYTAGIFARLRRIGNCPSRRELRKMMEFDEQLQGKGLLDVGSTSLNHLFCHPWHARIWTLQEVVFSKDCQVLCGNEIIPWDLYFKAARFLIFEEFIDELDAQAWKNYVSINIREDTRNSLLSSSSTIGGNEINTLLTSTLTQVRHLQATNPKDKIYGLYAVFSALGCSLPAPEYGKALQTIYEEACLAIILHSGSLRILEYASSNARTKDLPSWVADWQDEDVTLVNPPASATEESRISKTHLSTLSPASGQLHVRGRFIGSISARAENDFATLEFPSSSLPILKGKSYELVGDEVDSLRLLVHRVRLFREWIRLVARIPSSYFAEESDDLFHKLVTFDSDSSDIHLFNAWVDVLQYPDTLYDLSNGERVAEKWKSVDLANGDHWTTEYSHCSIVAAALATKSASKTGQVCLEFAKLIDFIAHISGNMGNRALIFVQDNLLHETLPGTAFYKAAVDDHVVLLEGADSPLVVRQQGDHWTFVGPAFVLGLMDGEAWFDEAGEVQDLQDFVLI